MEILQSLKEDFLTALGNHTIMYNAITNRHLGFRISESPMWFQYRGVTEDGEKLLFVSSQECEIRFEVPCTEEQRDYAQYHSEETYDYFREIKYKYLKENHPTVYTEIIN